MRLATNMLVAGGVIAAAVVLKKLVRRRRGADRAPVDMTAVATESGIANVDPVPLSQVAGEGIDLDGDTAAHREISELRDRLPRH